MSLQMKMDDGKTSNVHGQKVVGSIPSLSQWCHQVKYLVVADLYIYVTEGSFIIIIIIIIIITSICC